MKGGNVITMDNSMTQEKANQVPASPFANRYLAEMLENERKRICGVMGCSLSPEDVDCAVDLARCPFCFLEFGSHDQSECALKYVAKAMKEGSPDPVNIPTPRAVGNPTGGQA